MDASTMHTQTTPGSGPTPSDRLATLTRREREVLALIAAGASNEGIRDALVVSPKTVETHVTSIFMKLEVRRGTRTHPRVMAARMWLAPRRGPLH